MWRSYLLRIGHPSLLPSVTSSPCCRLCLPAPAFGKAKRYSGLPHRHTQEALLKPRLNPTLLGPTLHTCIHSESFFNILDSLQHSNSSETPSHSNCTGWYSNPCSATTSQGVMLLCFCSEYPEEGRTAGHLRLVWLGSEIISPHYVLLGAVVLFHAAAFSIEGGKQLLLQSHVNLQHTPPAAIRSLVKNCNRKSSTSDAFVSALSPASPTKKTHHLGVWSHEAAAFLPHKSVAWLR